MGRKTMSNPAMPRWSSYNTWNQESDSESGEEDEVSVPVIVRATENVYHLKIGTIYGVEEFTDLAEDEPYAVQFEPDRAWFGDPHADFYKYELHEDIYPETRALVSMCNSAKSNWISLNRIATHIRR